MDILVRECRHKNENYTKIVYKEKQLCETTPLDFYSVIAFISLSLSSLCCLSEADWIDYHLSLIVDTEDLL